MPSWLLWLLGAAAILAEGPLLQLASAQEWTLQLAIPCTMYIGLRRPFAVGAILLALWLPLADWASMCPGGLYGLGLVVLFILCRLVEPLIDVSRWSPFHGLLCAMGVFIHQCTIALALLILEPSSPALFAALVTSLMSMLLTALAGWPLGWLLARIDRWFEGRQQGRRLRI